MGACLGQFERVGAYLNSTHRLCMGALSIGAHFGAYQWALVGRGRRDSCYLISGDSANFPERGYMHLAYVAFMMIVGIRWLTHPLPLPPTSYSDPLHSDHGRDQNRVGPELQRSRSGKQFLYRRRLTGRALVKTTSDP